MTESPLADNLQRVQAQIASACARANRDPAEVTLVAVSKTHPAQAVLEGLALGLQHFGENRVEEAQIKIPAVAAEAPSNTAVWHMIGHWQSRKVKDGLGLFQVVHSVDTLKLAQRIAHLCEDRPVLPKVFLQINTSGEDQKSGFEAVGWQTDPAVQDRLFEQVGQVLAMPHLQVVGLMTMAPFGAPEGTLRQVFSSLAQLKAAIQVQFGVTLPDLSMGMTDDYPIAIEEGATVIRVGRALFGERHYP
jgi:pyridoxal phosphate enzyme (YggS family)